MLLFSFLQFFILRGCFVGKVGENLYISQKLAEIEDPQERQKQIDLLKNGSIMTWQHVNMHGRYDFNVEGNQIPFNMDKISTLIIK